MLGDLRDVRMQRGRPVLDLLERASLFTGGRLLAHARDVNRGGVVELQEDRSEDEGRGESADEDRDLLIARRGADEIAGLQVLRGRAAVRGGDADDGADGESGHVVRRTGPA